MLSTSQAQIYEYYTNTKIYRILILIGTLYGEEPRRNVIQFSARSNN